MKLSVNPVTVEIYDEDDVWTLAANSMDTDRSEP